MDKIKKYTKLLIFLVIIVIILIIAMLLIKKNGDEQEKQYDVAYENENVSQEDIPNISFAEYSMVKDCLQKYIHALNIESSSYYGYDESNEIVKVVEEKEIKNNIYDLLNKDYIEKNKISLESIYNHVDVLKKNKIVIPLDVKKEAEKEGDTIKRYYIDALIVSTSDNTDYSQVSMIVDIDNQNKTFSIIPEDVNLDKSYNSIAKNDNNEVESVVITEEKIVREYFSLYKNIVLSNAEFIYSKLNEEYKQKRFPDFESFQKYVERNKKMLRQIRIEQYDLIRYDDYYQYVCVDQYGNMYIFNEKETLDYEILLDIYTIDTPQFIEKYASATTQNKVLLNIEKIEQALNSGDYTYVYSKLADSFKENKFKTQESFEKYMKENLYDYMSFEYKTFKNEGNTYIYNVAVSDLLNESAKEVNLQIIMQLKEDRDFVMSFSITEE